MILVLTRLPADRLNKEALGVCAGVKPKHRGIFTQLYICQLLIPRLHKKSI